MALQIKIFGKLAEVTNSSELTIDNVQDTDGLKQLLFKTYPALQDMKFFIAVDNKMVKENSVITSNSSLALLPPFSGG